MKYLKRFFTLVLASTLFTTPVMATENDNSEAAFESQTNEAEKDNNLIPEVEEQKKIGSYLNYLDNLITLKQRKLDQLQSLKKFMLQNLFI